jgi:hypothetical protein
MSNFAQVLFNLSLFGAETSCLVPKLLAVGLEQLQLRPAGLPLALHWGVEQIIAMSVRLVMYKPD